MADHYPQEPHKGRHDKALSAIDRDQDRRNAGSSRGRVAGAVDEGNGKGKGGAFGGTKSALPAFKKAMGGPVDSRRRTA